LSAEIVEQIRDLAAKNFAKAGSDDVKIEMDPAGNVDLSDVGDGGGFGVLGRFNVMAGEETLATVSGASVSGNGGPGISENAVSETQYIQANSELPIELSGEPWFLSADFSRDGSDLEIVGEDGQVMVIENYFLQSSPPDITTDAGVVLKGAIAVRLAGSQTPGQYAQSAPGGTADPIGRVETATGEITVIRADGSEETLSQGDSIFLGDILETGSDGAVGITLADESTFSLGEDGRVTMDDMIYDPGGQEGSLGVSILQGAFTFVSGQIAKTDPNAMEITTPTATIGIRGTAGGGSIDGLGVTTAALMPEVSGFVGEMTIGNSAGTQTINQALQAVNIASINGAPTAPFTMTAQQLGQTFGSAMSALPNAAAIADNIIQGAAQGQAQQQAAEQAAADAAVGAADADAAADAAAADAAQAGTAADAAQAEADAAAQVAAQAAADAQAPGATPEQQAAADAAQADAAQAEAQAQAAADAAGAAQVAAAAAQVDAAQAASIVAQAQAAVVQTSATGAVAGAALAAGITVPGADALQAADAAVQAAVQAVQAAQDAQAQAAADAGVPPDAGDGPIDGNAPTDGAPPPDDGAPLDDGGPIDGPAADFGPDFGPDFGQPIGPDPFAGLFGDPLTGPDSFFDAAFDPIFDPTLGPDLDPFFDDAPPDLPPPEFDPSLDNFVDFADTSGTIALTDLNDIIITSNAGTQTVSLSGAAALGDIYDAEFVADNLTLDNLGNVLEVDGSFNTLTGGSGSDTLNLGIFGADISNLSGIEIVNGGDGTDSVSLASATSNLTLSGGIETVVGSSGTDSITLGSNGATLTDVSAVETITGGVGIDTVTVSDSTSTDIHGGAGDDVLTGGLGNDLITGEAGADTLTGGSGNDRFDYTAASSSTSAASDTITDFDATDDTEQIYLEKLKTGTFSFIGASAFSAGSNTEARFDDTTKVLEIDLDGDGAADMEMVLTGVSLADLGTADFKISGPDVTVTVSGTQSYTLTATQGEIITASAGDDAITLSGNAEFDDSFDGGAGADELIFDSASTANTISVANTETITAKAGADNVTLTTAITSGVIGMGGGTDTLTLADGTNSVAVLSAETITGGTGNDTVKTSINGPSESLIFDGVDDAVNITNATKLATGTGDFTYEAWIRTTEATNRGDIISVGDNTTTSAGGYLFVFGGQLRFDLSNTQGPTSTVSGGVADGLWHHVAVTSTSGLIQLYVDGETTGPTQSMTPNFTVTNASLGSAIGGGGAFDGQLSTVRAWTAARTQTEIQSGMLVSAYNATGVQGDLTQIAGQWLFNDGTGTNINDDSGNLYAGTLVNQTPGSETWVNGQAGSRLTTTQFTTIDLGAGTDTMSFANGTNTSTLSNVETITGGTGNDTITLATAITSGSVDLKEGSDSLTLANGTNTLSVGNVETVNGGTGADNVTLSASAVSGDIIDLNGGTDSLTLAAGGNTVDLRDIETVTGGTGSDVVTISTTGTWNIDLGTGTNTVTLNTGVSGTYNFTLTNVSSITNGSTGADTMTLANTQNGLAVRLGGGSDELILADGGNTVSVWEDVETVTGGTGDDNVSGDSAFVNGNVMNLGAGVDTVTLASGTNILTVSGTETVTGNAGADTITVSDSTATTINGNAGNDTLTGGSGADTLTGGSGVDTFIMADATGFGDVITDFLDSGSTSGADIFDLGTSVSGANLRGTGASFQTAATASGTTLGTDTGLLVVSGAVTGLSAAVALTEANNLSGGITASDQFYMLASAGTDSTLYRVSDSGDGGVWDTAETVATFNGLSNTDLGTIDATSFADFV